MKIAALIVGHTRTFEYCLDNWNDKLFSKYDIDPYFYTWSIKGTRLDPIEDTAQQWDHQHPFKEAPEPRLDTSYIGREQIASILHRIPANWKIKVYDQTKVQMINPVAAGQFHNLQNFCPMLFLLRQAFLKMNHTAKYDYVMRFRPDAIFTNPEKLDLLKFRRLQLPIYASDWGPHDYFAFGPFDLMQQYCTLYDHVAALLQNSEVRDSHSAYRVYLQQNRIPYEDTTQFRMSFIRKGFVDEQHNKRHKDINDKPIIIDNEILGNVSI